MFYVLFSVVAGMLSIQHLNILYLYDFLNSISQCTQAPKPNRLLFGHNITIFIHILECIVHILTGSALDKNNELSKEKNKVKYFELGLCGQ